MRDLSREIFLAQHYGNVSPEEFMVPYPSLTELVTGQSIKHAKKVIFKDFHITNGDILESAGKLANWILSQGIGYGDRIHVKSVEGKDAVFLAYGIWMTGAVLVTGKVKDPKSLEIKLTIDKNTYPEKDKLESFSHTVTIPETQNLNDEAVVIAGPDRHVRLSHYNLLVNAVGLQQILTISDSSLISINVETWTLPWIILNTIMPLTSGATVSNKGNVHIRIGTSREMGCDYRIFEKWSSISSEKPRRIYFLPEAGGAISVGTQPVPLLKLRIEEGTIAFQGHSVMHGYTDANLNEEIYKNGWVIITLSAVD